MTYKTLADAWYNPNRAWPNLVYMSTTNLCNARCLSCMNELVQAPRGIMSLDTFKRIVAKIKERGIAIGSMFCFGEPLMDPTLADKYAYGNAEGVLLSENVGLNTNCSMLFPDRYDGILQHTPNITLSFHNVEAEYERLTGLSWTVSYQNAVRFIEYRDKHRPGYSIRIGVNEVPGADLTAVKRAFADYNVAYEVDVYIRWKPPILTGLLERTVRNPWWRCDGYTGSMQVSWNGNCQMCAFDIIGTPRHAETTYANILDHSWVEIEHRFREAWRNGPALCKRCDYWHRADAMVSNDCRIPDPLPADWHDWQIPYVGTDVRR